MREIKHYFKDRLKSPVFLLVCFFLFLFIQWVAIVLFKENTRESFSHVYDYIPLILAGLMLGIFVLRLFVKLFDTLDTKQKKYYLLFVGFLVAYGVYRTFVLYDTIIGLIYQGAVSVILVLGLSFLIRQIFLWRFPASLWKFLIISLIFFSVCGVLSIVGPTQVLTGFPPQKCFQITSYTFATNCPGPARIPGEPMAIDCMEMMMPSVSTSELCQNITEKDFWRKPTGEEKVVWKAEPISEYMEMFFNQIGLIITGRKDS